MSNKLFISPLIAAWTWIGYLLYPVSSQTLTDIYCKHNGIRLKLVYFKTKAFVIELELQIFWFCVFDIILQPHPLVMEAPD